MKRKSKMKSITVLETSMDNEIVIKTEEAKHWLRIMLAEQLNSSPETALSEAYRIGACVKCEEFLDLIEAVYFTRSR
jgi:urease accessory protein UreF